MTFLKQNLTNEISHTPRPSEQTSRLTEFFPVVLHFKLNQKLSPQKYLFGLLLLFLCQHVFAQIFIIPNVNLQDGMMPEHGFLPGRKFKYLQTVHVYDFSKHRLRVELYDTRAQMNLKQTSCSDLAFTNTSEFNSPNCIYIVGNYWIKLLSQAGANIDSMSTDTLRIKLEGIDARIIGFGYIRVHGLCQMNITYRNITKTYCIDITDADKNSPISPYAFVTRSTATRIMASAAMREVIEQFFNDLKTY